MPRTDPSRTLHPCARFTLAALIVLCSIAPAVPLPAGGEAGSADSVSADTARTAVDDSTAEESCPPANPVMRIILDKEGEILIELLPGVAPIAVERILTLVRDGFYDGLRFHRVEPYLIQTGKWESELPPIEGEMFFQKVSHDVGCVGMARYPDDYDSATTQFYIMKKHRPRLNGEYTVIGKVLKGMDCVMKVKKGCKIDRVVLLE
jgi:cyclophilin family peptidyl-prolyl cis-trans isomerase